jgi:hypothetical protein
MGESLIQFLIKSLIKSVPAVAVKQVEMRSMILEGLVVR